MGAEEERVQRRGLKAARPEQERKAASLSEEGGLGQEGGGGHSMG